MHQLTSKKNKIIIYLTLLFILSTTNNKTLGIKKNYFTTIDKINVEGLSKDHNLKMMNTLSDLSYNNIFFVNKEEIDKIIYADTSVEWYFAKKIYPRKINLVIKPAKILVKISSKKDLFVGSNGKLIVKKNVKKTLPMLFGEFNSDKFLELKKNISLSKFNFLDLKSIFFYPSHRWDILTTNDILIKLPKKNLLESLKIAKKIIDDDRFKENKVIDLRISKNIITKNEQ